MEQRSDRYRRIGLDEIEAAMKEARRLRAEHVVGGVRRLIGLLRKRIAGRGRRAGTAAGARA